MMPQRISVCLNLNDFKYLIDHQFIREIREFQYSFTLSAIVNVVILTNMNPTVYPCYGVGVSYMYVAKLQNQQ